MKRVDGGAGCLRGHRGSFTEGKLGSQGWGDGNSRAVFFIASVIGLSSPATCVASCLNSEVKWETHNDIKDLVFVFFNA